MGNLLAYSGIVTKVRAMEGKLLTPGQFEKIAGLGSVPEIVEYLKKNTAYVDVLETLSEEQIHRGNIEKVLVQSLYHDYTKLYRFCGQKQRRFMKLVMKSYEIDLINYCFRIVINHYKQPFDLGYKQPVFLTGTRRCPSRSSSHPGRPMSWWRISKEQSTMNRCVSFGIPRM